MNKQQIGVSALGLAVVVALYFFGNTVRADNSAQTAVSPNGSGQSIDTKNILAASKAGLAPEKLAHIMRLENSVVRGNVREQQLEADQALAAYYRDSVDNGFLSYAYYTAEASKLENSEKNLTFAAQLFLNNLRGQDNGALRAWMAENSRDLFSRALALNPTNDSAKIGLGATYIFGGVGQQPANVMKGIQEILEVSRRDSLNMYAQLMLGLGGIQSGQYDRAVQRLQKVVRFDRSNMEAVLSLAEAYEGLGDETSAKSWYEKAKAQTTNPELVKLIDQKLTTIK